MTDTGSHPHSLDTPESGAVASEAPDPGKPVSLWGDARRQLLRKPIFLLACLYLLVMVSMALFPGLWSDLKPQEACDLANSRVPPVWWQWPLSWDAFVASADHPFGFGVQGCDYYAYAIYGARPSLAIAVVGTSGIVLVGSLIGLAAGYFGGWVDTLLSRMTDIFLALPFLLGAVVVLVLFPERNIWIIALVFIVLSWTTIARLMRGTVIEAKNLDYVQAARALGASNRRIMLRHILPNAFAPVVVLATILLGSLVVAEATLTYLGVGLQLPDASWGIMLSAHQDFYARDPWLLLFPLVLLVGTVLSFILAGDALRDALDPKLQE